MRFGRPAIRCLPKGQLAEVWNYLQALFRLLSAYTRQQYTEIPWQSILLVAGCDSLLCDASRSYS